MELKFRKLRADEIDARIGSIRGNGLSLLLYKDARCDMNVLDETVGAFDWKRVHSRDNANCTVYIWDGEKKEWVGKEDTGTESNTEAEKGLASDSFKRACVNWGIGRELYTAPFIWIVNETGCNINGGKCFDKFAVTDIDYDKSGNISKLEIYNKTLNKVCYTFGCNGSVKTKAAPKQIVKDAPKQIVVEQKTTEVISNELLDNIIAVKDFLAGNAGALKYYLDLFHHRTLNEFLDEECLRIFEQLKKNKKL